MEHVSDSMEIPVTGVHVGMIPDMSNYHESQHFPMSMDQMSFVDPMPYGSEFNSVMMANNNSAHMQSTDGSMGSSSISISNQLGLDDSPMQDCVTRKDKLLALNISVPQQAQLCNEPIMNLGADDGSIGSVQSSEYQRKTGQVQHNLGSTDSQAHSAWSKRKERPESIGKSGLQRGRPPKKQASRIDSVTKPQSESFNAIRSKMRESLAAALALACQKPGSISTAKEDKSEHTITHQMSAGSHSAESISMMGGNVPHSVNKEGGISQGSALGSTASEYQELSCQISPKRSNFSGGEDFQEFQFNSILPDGDNILVKDDLLQGNGLSWAFHVDAQMEEGKEAQNSDKASSAKVGTNIQDNNKKKVAILIPENLAFKIEGELFKLFGGINKKYREKGRSLLFNLKDQKNPELRERVMSGDISPERLCSMSAEELASKELSEWRIAKAEEFAQMVVLPDTEVDMRRLVKKTHKGEYQVEFVEHDDDGIADEVSSGSSMHVQRLPKKEIGNHSPNQNLRDEEGVTGQEKTSENEEFSGSLIIPTDGTDLMQGMMVDDELKDVTALPPIVSLDEFMESLNSEPPFENLSEGAAQKILLPHEVSSKAVSKTKASGRTSLSLRDASSRRANVGKKYDADMALKSSGPEKRVLASSAEEVKTIWEGILQLNISSFAAVRGVFQSGEKTSTKEWSTSLEIKGRVRLDAFEKFLQELPKSRTRALMIIQFVLKDKSSESIISEAVASYTLDERLGFAEPAAGVELYLCPPTPRISELLNKHMQKESGESDSSMENGLIGVVVWRRAHHIISPNASSHHKHTSKKQPFSHSTNRLKTPSNVVNVHVNNSTTRPIAKNMSHSKPEPEPEEDDDIPPGFGPGAAKDEDDLPEFNFCGGFNSSAPSLPLPCVAKTIQTPVDHMRELIKKYGQSGGEADGGVTTNRVESRGRRVETWEDDDDIPEWQPEAPSHSVARGGSSLLVNRPPLSGGRWQQPNPNVSGARWRQQ